MFARHGLGKIVDDFSDIASVVAEMLEDDTYQAYKDNLVRYQNRGVFDAAAVLADK